MRECGRVVFFSGSDGYGFIGRQNGARDVFVHFRDIVDRDYLQKGELVTFDIHETKRGPRAANVKRLSEQEEKPTDEPKKN